MSPNIPNEKVPELFVKKQVELLRDYPEEKLKAGDIVYGELIPNGNFYLSNEKKLTFDKNATEGVDYKMINTNN